MRITENLEQLKPYLPLAEFKALSYGLDGEEGREIDGILGETRERIATMPKTYEQDGLGDNAVVHLHYFLGGSDWYITERDVSGPPDHQAFGYAVLNGDLEMAELGYISIPELIANNVELDLYWTPTTLGAIKASRGVTS